ncbi:MAG: tRNA (guanine(46)-N(7))-methyltransferase TrmB [Gemmobacter sp.]|nr:tRNA (guanine(46)-N(7))-methyltransferase TrmB [Gemmobacter sp.]
MSGTEMASANMAETLKRRNFYGRRAGKTIKPHQRLWLSEDLESLVPEGIKPEENPDRLPLDLTSVFKDGRPVWLEVGFGGGEHMVHIAAQNPSIGLIGCEPYINGVVMLLGKIRRAQVTNLALYPGDVRDLFDVLPDASIDKAFLNYPDPWHKRRHHGRRFVTQGYLTQLARVLRPGAEFRMATDIPDYVRQALIEVPQAGFTLENHGGTPWSDWISTRYEKKALREGRVPDYLTWRRAG